MTLRKAVRQRFLEDCVGTVKGDWKVLIVDAYTMAVLGSCCKNSDVMEKRVTLIENLNMTRQPLPTYPAIYLLSPTAESIDRAIQDWSGPSRPYASAHLFFTSRVRDDLMDKIGQSAMARYIGSLKELFVDFYCLESQVFSLKMEHELFQFFGPRKGAFQDQYHLIAERVLTVCTTVNENPIIRFQNTDTASAFAKVLQEKVDHYLSLNPKYKQEATEPRGTLLILDRTVDVLAPLLHEFTYQAMLYDLLPKALKENRYTHTYENAAGTMVTREVLLDESDHLWTENRHKHISDVTADVTKGLQTFTEAHKGLRDIQSKAGSKDKGSSSSGDAGGGDVDLKKVAQAVRQMPGYQDKLNKFSLHIDVASKLMAEIKQYGLTDLALVEQLVATGETADGNKATDKDLRKEVERKLSDPALNRQTKIRLLLVYIVSQGGLKEKERAELLNLAGIGTDDTTLLNNLIYMDVSIERPKKSGGLFAKTKVKRKKRIGGDSASAVDTYDTSRYVPVVKGILEAEVGDKLSVADFPHTKEAPSSGATSSSKDSNRPVSPAPAGGKSLRGPRPKFSLTKSSSKDEGVLSPDDLDKIQLEGSRIIVFIVGGVTLSEVRSVYEVMREHKRDVIIGSTSIVTPTMFIEQLTNLSAQQMPPRSNSGVGTNPLPAGLMVDTHFGQPAK